MTATVHVFRFHFFALCQNVVREINLNFKLTFVANTCHILIVLYLKVQFTSFVTGVAPNSLHVQFGGDLIRRLDPYEHPLVLQNEYLSKIGYQDVYRIQMESLSVDLGYLIRFYSGKNFETNLLLQRIDFSESSSSEKLDLKLRKLCHSVTISYIP